MTYNLSAFIPYTKHALFREDVQAVERALHSNHLTQGPEVEAFEAELCGVTGARYAVAVSSGTAALHAICAAGRGLVQMPAISFVATANAAHAAGRDVVFVDGTPEDGSVGYDLWASIGGDLSPHPAASVLDLAHALGAPQRFDIIGAATYSFHPAKHVTTGEGGAVCTNDADLAESCRLFRAHGRRGTEQVAFGLNYRLPDLSAALGRSQLTRLGWSIERRRSIAARYDEAFNAVGIETVQHSERSARHLYQLLIPNRDAVAERLKARGIGTAVHYPPIPLQPWWRKRGGYTPEQFPLAVAWSNRVLSIPLFPTLSDVEIARVIEAVKQECAP